MCCHLYCLWFSDGQSWWAETLKDAIIPTVITGILTTISSVMTAYITVHGVPDSKAHVRIDLFGCELSPRSE